MRSITRKTVYDSRSDEFLLYFVGDVHLGSRHCDERLLRRIAHEIADNPNAYWIGLGDYSEWINMRDPRFDPMELVGWLFGGEELRDIARAEAARFLDIMGPTAGRCLALCEGNHEEAILRHSETDAYSLIVEGLKGETAHRLDHRGFVNWVFSRGTGNAWTLRIFATHGSGGGRKAASAGRALEELASQVDGVDVIVRGHSHHASYLPLSKLRPGRKAAESVTVHAISIPALCRDMAYAQRKDYADVAVGFVRLRIKPDKREIKVDWHIGGG